MVWRFVLLLSNCWSKCKKEMRVWTATRINELTISFRHPLLDCTRIQDRFLLQSLLAALELQ